MGLKQNFVIIIHNICLLHKFDVSGLFRSEGGGSVLDLKMGKN